MLNEQLTKDIDLIKFLEEEKRARLENEVLKSAQLCVKIVEYVHSKTKDIDQLTIILSSLNKKRNQSKNAIKEMVNYTLQNIFPILIEDEKIKLLKTIIEISEGRIYVEFEYAEAVKSLTEIYLSRDNREEAAKMIQDIQIETFGSVDRIYKVNYILFQMKILLMKGDFIRTLIVGNKINRKHLNEAGLEKQKIEFYKYMIHYYNNEKQFIDVAKSYKILYDFIKELEGKYRDLSLKKSLDDKESTLLVVSNEILQNKENDNQLYFENFIMFLSLCPPEQETKEMFVDLDKNYKHDLEAHRSMYELVKIRLSDDIIRISSEFLSEYTNMQSFEKDPDGFHRTLFRKYLIQHDLGIFQKYFSQVKLERISQMIGIDVNEVEQELADMCIQKHIWAKINRINFTVNFKPKQDASDKLNEMNFDLNKMLEVIETTCHLIHKENLKYDIK